MSDKRSIVYEGPVRFVEQEGGYCAPAIVLGDSPEKESLNRLIEARFKGGDLPNDDKLYYLRINVEAYQKEQS